jgi:anti-sigma regulatory factor (Ser/Thr protein kinase)
VEAHRFFFESNAPAQDKSRLFTELRAFGTTAQWSPAIANEIELILEEWWSNLLNYAFEVQSAPWVSVTIVTNGARAEIEIQDNGVPFDPTACPDPDLNRPIELRTIGGLGIYMMKKLSTSMISERRGERNILRIEKDVLIPVLGAAKAQTKS